MPASNVKPGDKTFLERWEQTRKQGRGRYVLTSGVLVWGLPMFVVMTFFARETSDLTVGLVAVSAVIWAVGGAVFGILTWFFSERRYSRLTSRQEGTA